MNAISCYDHEFHVIKVSCDDASRNGFFHMMNFTQVSFTLWNCILKLVNISVHSLKINEYFFYLTPKFLAKMLNSQKKTLATCYTPFPF